MTAPTHRGPMPTARTTHARSRARFLRRSSAVGERGWREELPDHQLDEAPRGSAQWRRNERRAWNRAAGSAWRVTHAVVNYVEAFR